MDLGLAPDSVTSLRSLAHHVPASAFGQATDQAPRIADAVDFVPERLERRLECVDGRGLIEFSRFFFVVAGREVFDPQIVRQSNSHRELSAPYSGSGYLYT